MILFDLVCDQGHTFEAWFKDSRTFEMLKSSGHLTCETCGSTHVSKAIMAPRLSPRVGAEKSGRQFTQTDVPLAPEIVAETSAAAPSDSVAVKVSDTQHAEIRKILNKVRTYVEKNFDNVGDKFADEVRAMAYGEAEERGIYGEATAQDVKDLLDEGIDVMSLPTPRTDA